MAIYKFDELLKAHNTTADNVTTYGSDEHIAQSMPKQNFGKRLMNQYDTARKDIGTAVKKGASGEQNLLSTGLQTAGNVAKAAFAPITAAVEPLLEPVMQKVAQNPTAQKVFGTISDFASKNPELSKNIEAGLDIAGLGVTGQAGKVVKGAANIAQDATIGARNIAGKGLQNVGEKIQQTVIRPSGRDLSDGFKIENVAKYNVGGSLPQTVAKTHTKMNELSNALKEKLLDTDARLDLNKAFDETAQKLLANKTKSFGENEAIMRQLDSLRKEIQSLPTENGTVDLYDATNIKRGAGTKGAWAYNRPEIDATATEKIYTEFYNTLKNEIELLAPDGVKEINKQLSELIPINNAALRRLPVAERNNAISLTDTIGLTSSMFDPRTLLILGAQKASKSGRVGQALIKAGEAIKAAPRIKNPSVKKVNPLMEAAKKNLKVNKEAGFLDLSALSPRKITTDIKDAVSKELNNLDTKVLTVNGKPDLSKADTQFRLDQLKTILDKRALTNKEIIEANKLLDDVGIDVFPGKSLKVKGAIPENSLATEARKYKSAEEFVKAQGETLYHGGTPIKEVGNMRGNWKAFYMSEDPTYAKSYGGSKSVLNEMVLSKDAKIADLRKPSEELVAQLDKITQGRTTGKTFNIQKPDGSYVEVSEVTDKSDFGSYTQKQVIDGIRQGKAHFAEEPAIKEALKKLGYDGMITQESKFGANYGVWNKDVVKTKSQLTDIYNKAVGK